MSIEAMKQALEALEQLQGGCTDSDDGTVEAITVWCPDVITALRAAIEEAEKQEPVAWMYDLKQRGSFEGVSTEYSRVKLSIGENWVPLYTAPRQWQGLTKTEFLAAVDGLEDLEDCWVAIEAKLKEKNT